MLFHVWKTSVEYQHAGQLGSDYTEVSSITWLTSLAGADLSRTRNVGQSIICVVYKRGVHATNCQMVMPLYWNIAISFEGDHTGATMTGFALLRVWRWWQMVRDLKGHKMNLYYNNQMGLARSDPALTIVNPPNTRQIYRVILPITQSIPVSMHLLESLYKACKLKQKKQ